VTAALEGLRELAEIDQAFQDSHQDLFSEHEDDGGIEPKPLISVSNDYIVTITYVYKKMFCTS
jgi:hypothetical protein